MVDSDIDGIDFYDLISIRAELAASPDALPRILQDHSIRDAQALADIERRWMECIEANPDLQRSYRLFYDHHHAQFAEEARLEAARRAAAAPQPPPVALGTRLIAPPEPLPEPPPSTPPFPALDPLRSTAPTLDLRRGPELPFTQQAAPPPEITTPRAAVAPRLDESLTGTAPKLDIPRGPALPFASSASSALPPPGAAPPGPLAVTAPTVDVPRGPVLPFAERAAGAPRLEGSSPAIPATPSAPGLPTGTGPALDLPRGSAVPFGPGASAEPSTREPTPRAPSPLAETSLSLGLPRDLVRTLAGRAAAASRGAAAAPAALPPRGSAPSLPALTLEQHASLHVELALWPDQTDATLARYRLTREAKALLDDQLGERMARTPELRVAWDHACRTYQAWLVAPQGSR